MAPKTSFRSYSSPDRDSCLAIFDGNCPTYFAPNERIDYISFLDAVPDSYEVCEVAGRVVAAFGLGDDDGAGVSLNWIMLDPQSQGIGLGAVAIAHSEDGWGPGMDRVDMELQL